MKTKKTLWSLAAMTAVALTATLALTACDDDDDNGTGTGQREYTSQYFSVGSGTFHAEAMPASTTRNGISGLTFSSDNYVPGGTATITVSSNVEYDRFYIGVVGKTGYVEWVPSKTRANTYDYTIPLTLGKDANENYEMQVKGKTVDGDITSAYTVEVRMENFGGDIGTNNIAKVSGVWRYEYEQDDDMGTVFMDYRFLGGNTSGKVADFSLDWYETEDAWRVQVEGQYKLQGSTLRLYNKRVRQKYWNSEWTAWCNKGSAGSISPRINWQNQYNTWTDYLEQGEGDEVWECLVNDARTKMQWRKLKLIYDYDPISGETKVSYNYDTATPIRQLTKQ